MRHEFLLAATTSLLVVPVGAGCAEGTRAITAGSGGGAAGASTTAVQGAGGAATGTGGVSFSGAGAGGCPSFCSPDFMTVLDCNGGTVATCTGTDVCNAATGTCSTPC